MKIVTSGSYYEQGFAHGKAAAELIAENVEIVRHIFHEKKSDMGLYRQMLQKHYANIFQLEPDLEQDLRGISEGSGIPMDDIMQINTNFYFFADKICLAPEECSVIIAGPKATLDHKTYFIKNRDMHNRMRSVVLERRYDDGTCITEMNLAGIVTFPGSGVNDSGFAVSTTGVWSPNIPLNLSLIGNLNYSFSPHTLLRRCRSVDEAVDFLKGKIPYKISRSNLFLIDETKAVVVETTDKGYRLIDWEDDLLVHTNHFTHPDLLTYNPSREEYPSTYMRYDRAMELLRAQYGKIRFQDMLEIASDHANCPNHLCRHGEGNGGITVCSSITVLEDRKSWTSFGNPCESLVASDAIKK